MNHILSPALAERYEPLETIGYGAFATVIKARSRRNSHLVAIKHFQHPSGQRHSFFRELQLTIQLYHPNIVRCLDLHSAEPTSSDLILEFADHGNLRTRIESSPPLTFPRALPIIYHIVNGLVHAHHEGIIHRDLKPENILIFAASPTEIYKIADFGIAKFVGKAGKTLTNVGSPVYMAPEQFYDRYDIKTDIYALGIMFYELLHGKRPFEGSHAVIFKGHLEGTAQITVDLPAQAKQLLQEMLAKQPEDRPHAIAVRAALEVIASRYGISLSLPTLEDDHQPHTHMPQSGEFIFDELFNATQPLTLDSTAPPSVASQPTVPTAPTAVSSLESAPTSQETVTPHMQNKSADHFFDFDADENNDSLPSPTPPDRSTSSLQAESLFDEGFANAERVQDNLVFRLSGERAEASFQSGQLHITPQWTRAVDTKSLSLVNLNDEDALLVVTQKGVYELNAQAGKGMTLYQGDVKSIGTPTQGLLPLLADQQVIALQRTHTEPHVWETRGSLAQVCFAPEAQGVAAIAQRTLYYHDHQGALQWSGRFGTHASDLYIDFEPSGELLVTGCHDKDYGVYFYQPNGQVTAQHWLPGRMVAAARCHFDTGTWIIVTNHSGSQLLRLAPHGTIVNPRPIDRPLRRLVGTSLWLSGVDENDCLYILDPATGHMAPLSLSGNCLAYCPGPDEHTLYVLEERSEVLRYISVFAIEQMTAEGTTHA